MTDTFIGGLMIAGVILAVLSGLEIAVALIIMSLLGVWLLAGPMVAERMFAMAGYSSLQEQVFAAIPLFVLMGMLVSTSNVGRDTFRVAAWALRRLPGGLGMATVGANAAFAAVTGISVASAAVFGRIAVPEMLRFGYDPRIAAGTVAGSSILGMLLPPSVLLILYGIIAEVSIGGMFIAGIIPGLIMAFAFALGLFVIGLLRPAAVGRDVTTQPVDDGMTGWLALRMMAPIVLLILLVMGGLYTGTFTPAESGALGAAGALAIAASRRRLTLTVVRAVLRDTGYISAGLMVILLGASFYSQMLTMSGVPLEITSALQGLDRTSFWFLYLAILIALGMVLDSTSLMLIVVPIAIPIASSFGINLIEFGIVTVITIEIGLLTPPFGMAVFAAKSSIDDPRVTLGAIFTGALPFALIMLLVAILLIQFPYLTTMLL